jgi:hypothetical protein
MRDETIKILHCWSFIVVGILCGNEWDGIIELKYVALDVPNIRKMYLRNEVKIYYDADEILLPLQLVSKYNFLLPIEH